MSLQDIIYFLDININRLNLYQKLRTLTGCKRPLQNIPEGFYKRRRNSLTYRIASQVYEAKDLGFNLIEISQLTDRSINVVNELIQRRLEIEPRIIHALKVLHPDREINNPYLTNLSTSSNKN